MIKLEWDVWWGMCLPEEIKVHHHHTLTTAQLASCWPLQWNTVFPSLADGLMIKVPSIYELRNATNPIRCFSFGKHYLPIVVELEGGRLERHPSCCCCSSFLQTSSVGDSESNNNIYRSLASSCNVLAKGPRIYSHNIDPPIADQPSFWPCPPRQGYCV